jgi:hypothetical protein
MASADGGWIYPIAWCPTCRRGCATREELIAHQLTRRHWKPIPPPAGVVDPAGAKQLKHAVEVAQARVHKKR